MNTSLGKATAGIYNDFTGLAKLRTQALNNDEAALKETARQFESMFISMMMKSMRDAVQDGGLFDKEKMEFYTDMYDKQLSLHLANGKGIGLAATLEKQLGGESIISKTEGNIYTDMDSYFAHKIAANAQQDIKQKQSSTEIIEKFSFSPQTPEEFINEVLPFAQDAAKKLGVDPKILLSQAALETGWGKHMMQGDDGNNSLNFFSIKAGQSWDGERVVKATLEYENGVPVSKKEPFRSYRSIKDSFNDYVDFVQKNPRYQQALKNVASPEQFITELHKAGYATDPDYSKKIIQIFQGDTLGSAVDILKNDQLKPLS